MRRIAVVSLLAGATALLPCLTGRAAEGPARGGPGAREPVLFRADEVQYDQDLALVVAKGNVEIDQRDQILLADTVTYNQRTDTVTASGHVSLLQPSGDIVFADFVELHDDMRDGFIKDVRLLLSDRSRMAGNTARRIAGTRTEIRRGVYSPCELCQEDPTRPPVWQIRAEEVVHDKELQLVEYRDAVIEIDGIPVFYTPYFSHPDPSVKRQSGFLAPAVGSGSSLGLHTTIPYYLVLGEDKDLTLRPMFTTNAGVVLDGEYRQRFANGSIDNEASIAVASRSPDTALANGTPPTGALRGHVFGNGEFDLTQDWRTGYQLERETDQSYMLRYHFRATDSFLSRELTQDSENFVQTPTNFLTSHLFAENFGHNSYGNISAYAFQSLISQVGDSTEPFVAPAASYFWTGDPDDLGGRLGFEASGVNLFRRTGPELRRVSSGTDWHLPFNGVIGDRFTFAASIRGDGYYSDHVALTPNFTTITTTTGTTIQLPSNVGTTTQYAGRVFPQTALTWRWPWVRTGVNGNAVIEPIAALIAAPGGLNPVKIPNEDSQGFEFDETSLFVPNRFAGYDRVDSGQRVDYGLRSELHSQALGTWETLVGQSYRFERDSPFPAGSGLEKQHSDVVGRIVSTPSSYWDFFYRFRIQPAAVAFRRQEAGTTAGPASLRVSMSYISIASVPGVSSVETGDQVSFGVQSELTRYWSLALADTRSINTSGATINSGLALTYRDDCIAVVGSVTQSGIRIGDVRPGVSVLLTLVFKNLGEVGVRPFSG